MVHQGRIKSHINYALHLFREQRQKNKSILVYLLGGAEADTETDSDSIEMYNDEY